jgi:hypothetical protein
MAKQKPYFDAIETRSRMLRNIEALLDEKEMPAELEQRCIALMSFYRNPPPPGMQYSWNHLWVMCSEFNQLYTKLQKLLWEDIEASKQAKTKLKRRVTAAELTITIWIKGHHFDEETGHVLIVPAPEPKAPPTAAEMELRKASINATWRKGSRDS